MNIFLLAAALAVPASAQMAVRVSPAWVGPFVGAMTGAGPSMGRGSVSLTALSQADTAGRLPFVDSPEIIEPIVEAMQTRGLTPEAFNALDSRTKIDILRAAAAAAESVAENAAAAAVAGAGQITPNSIGRVDRRVAHAESLGLYLSPRSREQVAAARGAVNEAAPRLKKLMEEFNRELAGKISAGAFDASNLIEKDGEGWRAADEPLDRRYASLSRLYDSRLDSSSRRVGPWTASEAELLEKTLMRPDVAAILEAEMPGASGRYLIRAADARREAGNWAGRYEALKMPAVSARLRSGKPRPSDFPAVARFYDWALTWSETATERARKTAAVADGSADFPAWAAVRADGDALYKKLDLRFKMGVSAAGGTLGGAAAVYFVSPENPLTRVEFAGPLTVGLAGLIAAVYYYIRRGSMLEYESTGHRIPSERIDAV